MDGKSVIITGSTKGIGHETAKIMLAAGANVVVNSRNERDVETTVKKLGADSKPDGIRNWATLRCGNIRKLSKTRRIHCPKFRKDRRSSEQCGTSMMSRTVWS